MWVGSKSTNFAPHCWFTFALSFITKSTLFFWIKWITLCVWPRWWTVCSVWVYWLAGAADTILYVPQPVQQHTTPLRAHNSTCEWCTLPREREGEKWIYLLTRGSVGWWCWDQDGGTEGHHNPLAGQGMTGHWAPYGTSSCVVALLWRPCCCVRQWTIRSSSGLSWVSPAHARYSSNDLTLDSLDDAGYKENYL